MLIRPFAALRPQPDKASAIASLPYDVMDSEEAREMAAGNPLSFLHVVRSEIDLPPEADCHSAAVYEKARDNLRALVDSGALLREAEPAIYLYRQTMGTHEQTAVVTKKRAATKRMTAPATSSPRAPTRGRFSSATAMRLPLTPSWKPSAKPNRSTIS